MADKKLIDTASDLFFNNDFSEMYRTKFASAAGRKELQEKGWYSGQYEQYINSKPELIWHYRKLAKLDLENKIKKSPEFAELYWQEYPQYKGNYNAVTNYNTPLFTAAYWDPREGPYGGYENPNPEPAPAPTPQPSPPPKDVDMDKIRRRAQARQTLLTGAAGAVEDEKTRYGKKRLLGSGY